MNLHFVLQSNEDVNEVILPISDICKKFTLSDICFTVEKTEICDEYEISFIPEKDIALTDFYILFNLEDNALVPEKTYYYQSGISTNSFARIIRADNKEPGLGSGRDIFMLKSEDYTFNTAFTTFNRFYTSFMFENGQMKANWSLEGKKVNKGEKYVLERIILNEGKEALEFFEEYTDLLHNRLKINIQKPVPCGWSSWSCYANGISEEKILDNARVIADEFSERGANLIQIDDGWQNSTSFDIIWDSHPQTFPSGMRDLCEKLKKMGLSLGLWMSAGLMSGNIENFKKYYDHINKADGEPKTSFSNVFPLDLSDDFVIEKTKEAFIRSKEEYGSEYFKIDFLINTICRMGDYEKPVFYNGDYSVAVYKKFIQAIRDAVGEDVFLLACGSPIGESAGIFDAIRVSPDIVWGGAGNPGHPGGWNILKLDAQNAVYRSPYHEKVFINDPDALLTREYGWGDDGLHLTEEEALTWATVVAFSGGHILINDIMFKLPQERKNIFKNIIPPYGKAARPVDFFEYPYSTHSIIPVDKKSTDTMLHAVYNWQDDVSVDKVVCFEGKSVIIDCHSLQIIGGYENEFVCQNIKPHNCRAICVKALKNHPFFVYCDENIYLGSGSVSDKYEEGVLNITSTAYDSSNIYVFIPNGDTSVVFLNGKKANIERTNTALFNGIICKIF